MVWGNNIGDGTDARYIGNGNSNRFYVYTTNKGNFGVELII